MTGDTLLLFFLKAPVKGMVKSRLAAVLGEDTALELYRCFVLDMLDTIDKSGFPCCICHHPPDAGENVAAWLGRQRSYQAQTGDDVGERMENAFRVVFSEGISRAVLVGSDIPDLPLTVLSGAFGSLVENDSVIGPAQDGGYYLIGFRRDRLTSEVFRGMPWGTDNVFMRTMRIFDLAGCRTHVVSVRRDVDTAQDLRDLMARHEQSFNSSRTMQFLARNWKRFFPQEGHHAPV